MIHRLWVIGKIILGVFGFITSIVFIGFILFSMPVFNQWGKEQIKSWIKANIKNEISYTDLNIHLIDGGSIDQLLIKDHHSDTLMYCSKLKFNLKKGLSSLWNKELRISDMDLENSLLKVIEYPEEKDNSLDVFLKTFDKPKPKKYEPKKPFQLEIEKVLVNQFAYSRLRVEDGIREYYYTDKGIIKIGALQLEANYYYFKDIDLEKPIFRIIKDSSKYTGPVYIAPPRDTTKYRCKDPFIVYIGNIRLRDGSFYYDASGNTIFQSIPEAAIQYDHVFLDRIQSNISKLHYENLEGNGRIKNFSCRINGQKEINNFSSHYVGISRTETKLENFVFQTERSILTDSLSFEYQGYPDFKKFNDRVFLRLLAKSSRINSADIRYFLPSASQNSFLQNNPHLFFQIHGEIAGKINSLKGYELSAGIGNEIEFKGNFSSRNITRKGREFFDLDIEHIKTSVAQVQKLIPQFHPDEKISKLGHIDFRGKFTGYLEDFVSSGKLETALGAVISDLRFNLRPGIEKAGFSGSLEFKEFDAGKLFNNPDLGNISLKSNIKNGFGLTSKNISADLDANISSLNFKKYNYTNIHFDGKLSPDFLDGKIQIADKNLDLDFRGMISNLQNSPKVDFTANVKKADLKELNLSKAGIIVSSEVNSNFRNVQLDHIDGDIHLAKTLLYDYEKNKVLTLGEIQLSQLRQNNILTTKIESEFLTGALKGDYKLASLFNSLTTYLNTHYPKISDGLGIPNKTVPIKGQYTGNFKGKTLGRIFHFLDWNIKFETFDAQINNNFNQDSIQIAVQFEELIYDSFRFPVSRHMIYGNSKEIIYKLENPTVFMGQKVLSRNMELTNKLDGKNLFTNIFSKDSNALQTLYDVGLNIEFNEGDKNIHLSKNDIILHGKNWKVRENASINLYKKSFMINDMILTDENSRIEIEDKNRKGIKLLLVNLNLNSFNGIIGSKKLKFEGFFDTRIEINNLYPLSDLFCTINMNNLRMNNANYGRTKIDLALSNPENPAKIVFSNQYKETKVDGKGSFNLPLKKNYLHPKYDFEFDIDVVGFPINFLENFIVDMDDTQGSLEGKVKLSYKLKKLTADGIAHTTEGSSKLAYLNTSYHFKNQKIVFAKNQIKFEDNILKDELDNPIKVNGNITHRNFVDYFINVEINSDKALVLNTQKGQNPYYYGYGLCQFNAEFVGPTDKLDMTLSGKTLKGTKFILPIQEDQVAEDTKFVHFSVKDSTGKIIANKPKKLSGLNVVMNIELTENAEISIVFDEKTGDILKGTGRGNLQVESLRDNTFSIKGSYEIEEGQYLFTLFNFVNKPFRLKRGGTITWTGDPLNANINLEASYEKLNVSPTLLVQEYILEDQELQQLARNRTNVDLTMLLTGSLLKPDINFNLHFPDVTGRLKSILDNKVRILKQNPDLLNQQVAALIAFRTFLGTNPGFVAGLGTTTISTMSEFLSSQLSIFVSNLLSEAFENVDFISGVDFNINYNLSNDPLNQTQFNQGVVVFSLKQRLWNDEWAVTLGGNYNANSTIYGNTYFNPETVLEWNTPVPGLKMRVYYKGVDSLQGNRHRVGAGVSLRKEFDSLLDFKKAIKKQKEESKKG